MFELLLLSIFCYISFFYSLRIRRKEKTYVEGQMHNYKFTKLSATILVAVLLIYYVIIFGILGWTFSWFLFGYVLFTATIIVLDRLLIVFHVDNKYVTDYFFNIKTYWLAKIYIAIRSIYVYVTIAGHLSYILLYGIFGASVITESTVSLTPEVFIAGYVERRSETEKPPYFMQRHFSEREFGSIETICDSSLGTSMFCKDLLFKKKADSRTIHIYSRKSPVFNKYLYSFYYNQKGEGQIYRISSGGDTLHIGRKSNTIPENYIVKESSGYYKHIIKRLNKSELGNLQEENVSYEKNPELYETVSREVR